MIFIYNENYGSYLGYLHLRCIDFRKSESYEFIDPSFLRVKMIQLMLNLTFKINYTRNKKTCYLAP